jgi:hypothetical protein
MGGIIAIIFFFTSVVLIWGGILFTRHKERMTIIDRGLKPEDMKALYERGTFQPREFNSMKWGIVLVAIGLAILMGIWLHETYMVPEGVYPGLIALFGGVGLVVYYLISTRKSRS